MAFLIYISILSVVMLGVSMAFDTSFRLIRNTRQWHEQVMAVDGAINMLRDDIWHAHQVAVLSPAHLRVDLSDDVVLIWRLELPVEDKDEPMAGPESGHFVRQTMQGGENTHTRHFPMSVSSLRFLADDSGLLIVELQQPGKDRFNRVHLPNLRRMIGGDR